MNGPFLNVTTPISTKNMVAAYIPLLLLLSWTRDRGCRQELVMLHYKNRLTFSHLMLNPTVDSAHFYIVILVLIPVM